MIFVTTHRTKLKKGNLSVKHKKSKNNRDIGGCLCCFDNASLCKLKKNSSLPSLRFLTIMLPLWKATAFFTIARAACVVERKVVKISVSVVSGYVYRSSVAGVSDSVVCQVAEDRVE